MILSDLSELEVCASSSSLHHLMRPSLHHSSHTDSHCGFTRTFPANMALCRPSGSDLWELIRGKLCRGVQVWRVENMELVELPEDKLGCFSTGDSYVVAYTYGADAPEHIVYMWQGMESTQDEKAACAAHAVTVEKDHCGGDAVQVLRGRLGNPASARKLVGARSCTCTLCAFPLYSYYRARVGAEALVRVSSLLCAA